MRIEWLRHVGMAIMLPLSFFACGETDTKGEPAKIEEKWITLNDDGYSIDYPESWEVSKSGQMGTVFIISSQLTSDDDSFKENVNFLIQDLTGAGMDLEKYVEVSTEQVQTLITDGDVTESERRKSNGKDFHRILYSGKQGIFHLMFEQYYWVIENKAYVLTFTCEEDTYDEYKKIGEQILNSFEFHVE